MPATLKRDPYKNYRFRVKFGNTPVAGVNNVSALSRSTESISFRSGQDDPTSYATPGLTSFEPVTLSKGITQSTEFHQWGRRINPAGGYTDSDADPLRKDLVIELCDDQGEPVQKYRLLNCWISEYQPFPDLNAGENEIAIQTLTLQHEGFVKD